MEDETEEIENTEEESEETPKRGKKGKVPPGDRIDGGRPLRIKKLNLKQERFCQLYASDREFFGNGTESYIEAYNLDTTKPNWSQTARACAYKLLTNTHILDRITNIMEETGFNDASVDKELSFLIKQNGDYASKLGAIKEFNKLKGRIQDKLDLTSKGKKLAPSVIKIVKYDDTTK